MDIEAAISYSLIIGVLLSIALIFTGAIFLFIHGGGDGFTLAVISSVHSTVNTRGVSIYEIFKGLLSYDGLSFIYLGLIVLIITPISRVLLLIFHFVDQRDKLYILLSTIVFFNLMIAIIVIPAFVHPL